MRGVAGFVIIMGFTIGEIRQSLHDTRSTLYISGFFKKMPRFYATVGYT